MNVIIRKGVIIKITDEEGNERYEDFDKLLPIDRVVTIDGNNNVYLYDNCIKVTPDMIEKEL